MSPEDNKTEASAKETEEKKSTKDIFSIWSDSLVGFSNIWEDSFVKLYNPWTEFIAELSEAATELSSNATPEEYKKFFEEWMAIYESTMGKFYPLQMSKPDKATLKKFLDSGKDLNKIFLSWVKETEVNMRKTTEILQSQPDPEKYKDCYDMWINSYEKTLNDFISIPSMESMKVISKNMGISGEFSESFTRMSKLWKNSFDNLYNPWIKAMEDISESATKISGGNAGPEAYKEFYNQWTNTLQKTFENIFNVRTMQPSKELFDGFMECSNISLNLYKSWIAALEKMSEKTMDISKISSAPETYNEFCKLWVKMNEKAFGDIFEDMPIASPMKEMIEPIKTVSNMYANMFSKMVCRGFEAPFKAPSKAP